MFFSKKSTKKTEEEQKENINAPLLDKSGPEAGMEEVVDLENDEKATNVTSGEDSGEEELPEQPKKKEKDEAPPANKDSFMYLGQYVIRFKFMFSLGLFLQILASMSELATPSMIGIVIENLSQGHYDFTFYMIKIYLVIVLVSPQPSNLLGLCFQRHSQEHSLQQNFMLNSHGA